MELWSVLSFGSYFFLSQCTCCIVRVRALGICQGKATHVAKLWYCMWGRGPRRNNATCSALDWLSVTSPATHKQIGSFWCWFLGGWVCVHSCGSLQRTFLWGWEFLPLPQPPPVFTVRGFEALFLQAGLSSLPHSPVPWDLSAHKCQTGQPPPWPPATASHTSHCLPHQPLPHLVRHVVLQSTCRTFEHINKMKKTQAFEYRVLVTKSRATINSMTKKNIFTYQLGVFHWSKYRCKNYVQNLNKEIISPRNFIPNNFHWIKQWLL